MDAPLLIHFSAKSAYIFGVKLLRVSKIYLLHALTDLLWGFLVIQQLEFGGSFPINISTWGFGYLGGGTRCMCSSFSGFDGNKISLAFS